MSDTVLTARSIRDRLALDGGVALVTGAGAVVGGGASIGRGLAHALSEAGAAVAVADVDGGRAEVVAEELRGRGGEAIALPVDVTDEDSVAAMVDAVVARWGRLTIAVNNAGVFGAVPAEEMTYAEWRRVTGVNLDGVFLCCRAEGRAMLPNGYGKIVNIASMSGRVVNNGLTQVHYNSSKAAVVHLTRSLAVEWGPRGVRVNSVSPGMVGSSDVARFDEVRDAMGDELARLTPLDALLDPTALQGAVVFLASEASDLVTGHDLLVDAGFTLW